MRETKIRLETPDGLGLFAQEWLPEEPSRAVVCVFHGLGEHGGQYIDVARAFVDHEIAMIAVDLRGHGRSDGKRGHTPSYDALLDDVDSLLANAAQRHPGTPLFLYGHSLGGNLVLNHALRRQPDVAGVIATSPWFRMTKDIARYKRVLATLLEPIFPALSFKTRSNNEVDVLDEVGLRRNAELYHNIISLRLLMTMRRAGRWALSYAGLLKTPTLLIHGDADPVTDPEASREFALRAGPTCQVSFPPGIGHNPHEEDESLVATIVGWVVLRIS